MHIRTCIHSISLIPLLCSSPGPCSPVQSCVWDINKTQQSGALSLRLPLSNSLLPSTDIPELSSFHARTACSILTPSPALAPTAEQNITPPASQWHLLHSLPNSGSHRLSWNTIVFHPYMLHCSQGTLKHVCLRTCASCLLLIYITTANNNNDDVLSRIGLYSQKKRL